MPRKALLVTFLCLFFLSAAASAQSVYRLTLDGGQEVPPVATDATGLCIAILNADETQLTTTCQHDVENVTVAHIHQNFPGQNGPIVFPFENVTSPFTGTWDIDQAGLDALRAGELYVNIHSDEAPAGEIRGQIGRASAGARAFPLAPPAMMALGNGGGLSGTCYAILNPNSQEYSINCHHNVDDVNSMQIRRGTADNDGPIVFFMDASTSNVASVSSRTLSDQADQFSGSITPISISEFIDDLLNGILYVNVGSDTDTLTALQGNNRVPPSTLFFSQFGSGGGFSSAITLTNASNTLDVSGQARFYNPDGGPLDVNIPAAALPPTSSVQGDFGMAGGVSAVDYTTSPFGRTDILAPDDPDAPIQTGTATIFANSDNEGVPGVADQGGVVQFSALGAITAVSASEALTSGIVPVQAVGGDGISFNTGIAVSNPNTHGIEVGLTLRDSTGAEVETTMRFVPGLGQRAENITELFTIDDSGPGGFQGTVTITSLQKCFRNGPDAAEDYTCVPAAPYDITFTAIALFQGVDAGTGSVGLFTTLPVTPVP